MFQREILAEQNPYIQNPEEKQKEMFPKWREISESANSGSTYHKCPFEQRPKGMVLWLYNISRWKNQKLSILVWAKSVFMDGNI